MKNNRRKVAKPCVHCSVPSVKYKCLLCNCTGKIEIPKAIKWHSEKLNDFTIIGTDFIPCDQCNGRGWILVPPFIAERYPHNKF